MFLDVLCVISVGDFVVGIFDVGNDVVGLFVEVGDEVDGICVSSSCSVGVLVVGSEV